MKLVNLHLDFPQQYLQAKLFVSLLSVWVTGWGTMMKEDGETVSGVDAVVGKPPRIRELNNLLLRLTA